MDTIDFPAILDTLNPANAYTFEWDGVPVKADEVVSLSIDGTQQNNFEYFSTSNSGATTLVLAASDLQNLGIGNATCTLKRERGTNNLSQPTAEGGRIAVEYTVTKTIYIQ
jgi:hypothetical protein